MGKSPLALALRTHTPGEKKSNKFQNELYSRGSNAGSSSFCCLLCFKGLANMEPLFRNGLAPYPTNIDGRQPSNEMPSHVTGEQSG